jgi:nucleotide-binding universal stress UspA family protein
MDKKFKTVLVPMDFSINTELVIEKTIEITEAKGCVHVLHVQTYEKSSFGFFRRMLLGYSRRQWLDDKKKSLQLLGEIKETIYQKRPDLSVCTWLVFGEPVEASIIQKAKHIHADLIIIGKNSSRSLFPFLNTVVPSRIAARSGAPVLVSKPGSLHSTIKTVVLPVDEGYPENKLQLLRALPFPGRLKIRLVTFQSQQCSPEAARHALVRTLRALKELNPFAVEYELIKGNNISKELLRYCEKVEAHVLIVKTEPVARNSRLLKRHIADLLPTASVTQIMAMGR